MQFTTELATIMFIVGCLLIATSVGIVRVWWTERKD